jgi:putative aldouronate transport system substrate-binding protein
MKNSMIKRIALLFAALFTTSVVYAGGGKDAGGAKRPTTLEFIAPQPVSQVNDWDLVLNEVYKQTDPSLNIRINYTFTGFDDVGQRVSLKIASGEQLDAVFAAQWTSPSMMQMIAQGLLLNLDKYFNNDAYPGLKKYFPADYLEANKFTDTKGESHIYGIPFTNAMGGKALYYRLDLAKKYGIGEIDSYDKMIRFFDAVKFNEPGVYPHTFLGSNDDLATYYIDLLSHTKPVTSGHNYIGIAGSGMSGDGTGLVWVVVGDDGKAYASRHFIPAMDTKFRSLMKAFKENDPLKNLRIAREWYSKGYLEPDILNQKDQEGQFVSGRAASFIRGLDTYTNIRQRLLEGVPGAELGAWVYYDNIRFNTTKADRGEFQAWNYLSIPTTSKNADLVMRFMDWIFSNQANHDLLEYGIPGRHWSAVGPTKYEIPAGVDPAKNYNFQGYVLTWNPLLTRYMVDIPDNIMTAMIKLSDPAALYQRLDAGFTFNPDPVAPEVAQLNDLAGFRRAIMAGVPANTDAEIARVQRLYEQAGIEKVAAEVEKQFNDFLKTHPYKGQ